MMDGEWRWLGNYLFSVFRWRPALLYLKVNGGIPNNLTCNLTHTIIIIHELERVRNLASDEET